MNKCSRMLAGGALLVSLVGILSADAATDVQWANPISGSYTDGSKWTGGNPPADDLTSHRAYIGFVGNNNITVTLDVNRSVAGLYLGNLDYNPAYYTLTGTNTLTLGASGITSGQGLGDNTISVSNLALGASADFDCTAGSASLTLSGIIAGDAAYTITKKGVGGLYLTGANTFAGGVTVTNGTLAIGNNAAIGTGTLRIEGGNVVASGADRVITNSVDIAGDFTKRDPNYDRSLTFSGPVTVKAGNWTVTNNDEYAGFVFSGTFGNGGNGYWLAKAGPTALLLSGTGSFSGGADGGGLELKSGRMFVGSVTALGSSVANLKLSGGTIQSDGFTARTIACPAVMLAGDVTLGGNDYIGGDPDIGGNPGRLTFSGSVTLMGNRRITLPGSSPGPYTVTISGSIGESNPGYGLTLAGAYGYRMLFLSGTNTYSGGTVITNNARVTVDGNTALGSGRLTLIDANNYAYFRTASPTVGSLAGGGGTIELGAAGVDTTLTVGSDDTSGSSAATIQQYSGQVGGLTKVGTGTQVLSGTNTYTGATTISNGTLLVNGSLNGASRVTVLGGGALGGSGMVGIVTNSGTLSPGDGIGALTTSNEVWNGGAQMAWEVKDPVAGPGVGWDLLKINGPLDIQATSGNPFVIRAISLGLDGGTGPVSGFDKSIVRVWLIETNTVGTVQNFSADKFVVDSSGFQNDPSGRFDVSTNASGNALLLTYIRSAGTRIVFR